ncbi:MAG: FMN-binding protein [Lapillicoccus sp.]
MRRIVITVMGTLSGLVLLFSYHTSLNSSLAISAGAPRTSGGAIPRAQASSGSPSPTATPSAAPSTGTPGTTAAPSTTTPSTAPSPAPSTTAPAPAPSTAAAPSGTFTGDSVQTRWGDVQVAITVVDGKITQSEAVTYPQNNGRDQEINAYALPVLAQEVTQAQSAQIDAVSGATVTSDGYIQSLQSALDQAHL